MGGGGGEYLLVMNNSHIYMHTLHASLKSPTHTIYISCQVAVQGHVGKGPGDKEIDDTLPKLDSMLVALASSRTHGHPKQTSNHVIPCS